MRRFISALGTALVATIAAVGVAAADCGALQAELARLQAGGGSAGEAAKYRRAWQEQGYVLQETRRQARAAGCYGGGFLFFRVQPQPVCRTLIPRIRQMEANLGKLQRLRAGSGSGTASQARRIRQRMVREGCYGPPGGGKEVRSLRDLPESGEPLPGGAEDGFTIRRGTYRTLCVRACDGYYFPISFATTRDRFVDDQQSCQAICPGAKVDLYVHANPGQQSEDMVSLSGARYTDLPSAFRYRTSYDASCSCKTGGGTRNYSTIATALPSIVRPDAVAPQADPVPTAPAARPAPGEDQETVANRDGEFVPGPVTAAATAGATATKPQGVRIVGPAYWGARQKEEVVLTPVPN